MSDAYTHLNLIEGVEDSAPKFGFGEFQKARFANDPLAVTRPEVAVEPRLGPPAC
jgi:hypothetical protein